MLPDLPQFKASTSYDPGSRAYGAGLPEKAGGIGGKQQRFEGGSAGKTADKLGMYGNRGAGRADAIFKIRGQK